ncbi:hypothetical protein DFR86_08400 [Acidianus sulfidivorans JP7]|uniref:Uncharacterized protein n=1 Tax=Acidianus sulfidivorans JP7 TaxID=619593 RepID=A0A2U9INC4_9CREN|nr:hypothetical protein [Acidianus sulfidivorans]AWR97569.1 hypothetical protein DFR86_08400 [Acidianus sulfidivorans JP7]
MNAKDQIIDSNSTTKKISKLYKLLITAEDIHEITGNPPTTDLNFIYGSEPIEDYELYKVGKGNFSYFVIYDLIKNEYIEFLKNVMLPYSNKTMETEIEYINFVLENGDFAIFQGDIDKVSMPMPKGIASSHTHPGICVFSHVDISTADDLFTRGYVVIGVMNPKCVSLFYRKGVYTEYDQQELRKLYKKVKSAKTIDELKEAYTNFKGYNVFFTSFLIS